MSAEVVAWLLFPGRLKVWLIGVASLRLLNVVLGYWAPYTMQRALFNRASKEFTALTARSVAIWTAATCAVTLMTAFNLNSAPLVDTCFLTFLLANAYFAAELFIYRTVSFSTVASPAFVASELAARCAIDCYGGMLVV